MVFWVVFYYIWVWKAWKPKDRFLNSDASNSDLNPDTEDDSNSISEMSSWGSLLLHLSIRWRSHHSLYRLSLLYNNPEPLSQDVHAFCVTLSLAYAFVQWITFLHPMWLGPIHPDCVTKNKIDIKGEITLNFLNDHSRYTQI